jgi:hypothetical protein
VEAVPSVLLVKWANRHCCMVSLFFMVGWLEVNKKLMARHGYETDIKYNCMNLNENI